MNRVKIGRVIFEITVTASILILLMGIFTVNYTLPEVVRDYSGFQVTVKENPKEYLLKAGRYNIKFSEAPFDNFIRGGKMLIEKFK